MKRILGIIIVLILLTSCTLHKNIDLKEVTTTLTQDGDYIETIPENAKKFIDSLEDTSVILNADEIKKYNQNLLNNSKASLYDIDNITSLTKSEIENYITNYKMPSLPKYDNAIAITSAEVSAILNNRNLDNIVGGVPQKGIIVNRTNLKSFPTSKHFFDNPSDTNFDKLQETELQVNTPVLVVHESADQKWKFVISPIYAGWVVGQDIAYSDPEEYNYFTKPKSFGVITEPTISLGSTSLAMGTTLRYIATKGDKYIFALPTRGEDGRVIGKVISLPRTQAHIGYLPYTKRNLYLQSFKYEDTPYSWGGMDFGVDCSSYVLNIFRTFGFLFPRNTSSQKEALTEMTSLIGQSASTKLHILEENYPSLIYQPGHVMIYLGKVAGDDYIIHASGSEYKVTVTKLNDSSYLNNIDRVIQIK